MPEIGIEVPVGRLKVAPVLPYTHWAADGEFLKPRTKRNQVELLVGLSLWRQHPKDYPATKALRGKSVPSS